MRQRVLIAATTGLIVGATGGFIEAAVWLAQLPWWPAVSPVAAAAMGLNAAAIAIPTGLWGLAARHLDPGRLQVRALAFSVVTLAYLVGGFYANHAWFPKVTSSSSLLFTGVLTIGWLLAVGFLLKRPTRAPAAMSQSAQRRVLRRLGLVALGPTALAGLCLVLPRLWFGSPQPASRQAATGQPERPNILLIVMDTVRADHLSCYGYPRPTSPNVDRIAQEGVLFEQASSTAPWAPAHAALFTGLYPSQHRTDETYPYLRDEVTTIAELAREAGYQTLGVSNNSWLGRTGFHQGFDDFVQIWQGDRIVSQLALVQIASALAGASMTAENQANAVLTNQLIRRWLDRARDPNRPFFLFINYFEPQFFYEPPEPYRSRFVSPANQSEAELRALRLLHWDAPPVRLDQTKQTVLADLYDGELAYLDARIGELLDALRARGLLDETIVVLTSDHGDNLGEHELVEHRFSLYEAVLHIPLILRYPKALPQGTRVAEPVSLVDVMPTLLKLSGVEPPEALRAVLPGSSLVGSGLRVPRDRFLLAEDSPSLGMLEQYRARPQDIERRYFTRSLRSLRRGPWKFIWSSDGQHELYDLSRDPGETRNLVNRWPRRAREMELQLLRLLQTLRRPEKEAQRE